MGDTAQSRMHPKRAAYDPHCLQRHSCFANSCQICTPRELVNPPRRPPCCTLHQLKENHMTGTNRGRAVPYKSKNHAPKIAKTEMSKSCFYFFGTFRFLHVLENNEAIGKSYFPDDFVSLNSFPFYVMGDTAQSRMHPKRAAYDPHCLQRHSLTCYSH